MATDASAESFDARFMKFYEICSDEEQQFLAWLFSFSPDALAAGDDPDVEGFGGSLLETTKQMQETQMSFNLQYLQLQSQMQHQNRSYTATSNILKTRHDTVKNSISNIR
jgi:hypothetical protein